MASLVRIPNTTTGGFVFGRVCAPASRISFRPRAHRRPMPVMMMPSALYGAFEKPPGGTAHPPRLWRFDQRAIDHVHHVLRAIALDHHIAGCPKSAPGRAGQRLRVAHFYLAQAVQPLSEHMAVNFSGMYPANPTTPEVHRQGGEHRFQRQVPPVEVPIATSRSVGAAQRGRGVVGRGRDRVSRRAGRGGRQIGHRRAGAAARANGRRLSRLDDGCGAIQKAPGRLCLRVMMLTAPAASASSATCAFFRQGRADHHRRGTFGRDAAQRSARPYAAFQIEHGDDPASWFHFSSAQHWVQRRADHFDIGSLDRFVRQLRTTAESSTTSTRILRLMTMRLPKR